MATIRRKKAEPFSILQRDPGPWPTLLINWMATLGIIVIFGLVMLFSASYTTGYLRFGDSLHFIRSQVLCLGLGVVAMALFSYIDYRFLRKLVWPGYLLCLVLLVLVLFSTPLNGCRRWISFGGFTVQVSEIAKFEMILLTAHLAAKAPRLEKLDPGSNRRVPPSVWLYQRLVRELIVPLLPLLLVLALLVLEPHMSGIVLTTAIVGTILLLGGNGGIITWAGAAIGIFLLETLLQHIDSIPYLQSRLDGWTQDLSQMTDQTLQSLYAIGSGGVTGLGGFGFLHGQVQVFGHMQDLQTQHGLEVVLGTGLFQQQNVQTGLLLQIEIFGRHAADLIHDLGHVLFPDLLQHALVGFLGVLLLRGQSGHVDAVQIEILQSLGAVVAGQTGGQGLIQRVLADEGGDGVLVSAHALGLGDVLQDAFLVRGQLFGLHHDELLKNRVIPAYALLKVWMAARSPLSRGADGVAGGPGHGPVPDCLPEQGCRRDGRARTTTARTREASPDLPLGLPCSKGKPQMASVKDAEGNFRGICGNGQG